MVHDSPFTTPSTGVIRTPRVARRDARARTGRSVARASLRALAVVIARVDEGDDDDVERVDMRARSIADVVREEWRTSDVDFVLDALRTTSCSRDVVNVARTRLLQGAREHRGELDADIAMAMTTTSLAMASRHSMTHAMVAHDGERRREDDVEGFNAWMEVVETIGETTTEALANTGRETRRAGRLHATFATALAHMYATTSKRAKPSTALTFLMSVASAGNAEASTRVGRAVIQIARNATDIEIATAVRACEEEDLTHLADVLTSSKEDLTVTEMNVLRLITNHSRIAYARVVSTLLEQMSSRANAIETLEQISHQELTEMERAGISEQIQRAINLVPGLHVKSGEIASTRALKILAPLATVSAANALFENEEVISSEILGLRLFREMLKCGMNVDEVVQVLRRAIDDERMEVRREALVIIAEILQEDKPIDASLIEEAKLRAENRISKSIVEIQAQLARGDRLIGVSESEFCSALYLVFTLYKDDASMQNMHIIRETFTILLAFLDQMILAEKKDTAEISIDVHDDCLPSVRSWGFKQTMVEVFLDAILCYPERFKRVLEDFKPARESCCWENWIVSLLIDAHLKVMKLKPKMPANGATQRLSMLSVSACSSLLIFTIEFGDKEWSQDIRSHVTSLCCEVLKLHFSALDERCALLLDSCASQCIDVLFENWFALNNRRLVSNAWSVKSASESLNMLRGVCWVAISRAAKAVYLKSTVLESIQALIADNVDHKLLESGAQTVVSCSNPHLKRSKIVNAGRVVSKKSPVSAMVALLVASLLQQVERTYSQDRPDQSWDEVVLECLELIDVLLPMTAFEADAEEVAESAVTMLENMVVQFQQLPAHMVCEIVHSVLRFHAQRSNLSDCLKTASRLLKLATRYTLDTLPDFPRELVKLMIAVREVVSKLSKSNSDVDVFVKHDAFISLTSSLVKVSSILMQDVYTPQVVCDGVRNYLSLVNAAFDACINAASALSTTSGSDIDIDGQRINAALVLAGSRLHHATSQITGLFPKEELQDLELHRREFMIYCSGVFTNLRALELTCSDAPLDGSLVAITNALAMADITKYSENLERLGTQTVAGQRTGAKSVSNPSRRENSSSNPRKRLRNPYLDAVIAQEGGRQEEYDDMADFIVCKPGRNYREVLGLT